LIVFNKKEKCGIINQPNSNRLQKQNPMSDNEIMSLPEWDVAFDESIEQFKKQNRKEPTLVELQNLIELLIRSFHANGFFVRPYEKVTIDRRQA